MSDPLSNPYNEHVIVDLVTEIYRLLLQLGHFEEDEVIWPPTGGHTLDFSLLDDSSRIDINVISLMQHLPFTGVGSRSTVVPTMRPVNYANPFELAMSRDIDKTDFRAPPSESRLNMGNAAPTVLLLLQGQESPDACLVLDIADNSIREYGSGFFELWDDYTRNETDEDLVEAYAHNYFNWPKQDATAYLERVVQNYRTGEWISNYYGDVDTASDKIPYFAEMRRTLCEDYGWPDNFREAEWKRDVKEIVQRLCVWE